LRPPNFDVFLFERPGAAPRRLTTSDATDYNAVFSPDGRWVVFTSERSGNADLFALELERTGAPVRLTSHPAMDDAAAFSPDGRRLAFVSTRDGNADIYIVPFAPGDTPGEPSAVNLTHRPGGDFNPAFSPDGQRIAYSRQDELWWGEDAQGKPEPRNFVTHVYVMNVDGSDVRRISPSGTPFRIENVEFGRVAGSPVWSPDGRALYYHVIGGTGPEIRRFDLDGTGETKVLADALSPAVAADGRLAFIRPQAREGMDQFDVLTRTGRVFSVTTAGGNLRAESDTAPSCFAPDVDRRSGRMVCHAPSPVADLATVDIPGGAWAFAPPGARLRAGLPDRVIELVGIRGYFPGLTAAGEVVSTLFYQGGPGPLVATSIDGRNPRTIFSRKGAFVWGTSIARDAGWAVTAVGPPFAPGEASVAIWKVPLDGSAAVNLTADLPGNNALPHVSPDGRRIVFRSGGDGGGSVHIMNSDGKERRQLGNASAIETMPALSPDGEWVVFSTNRAKGRKLWIERVDGTEGRFLEPDRLDIPDLSMHPRFSADGKWVVFTSDRAGFNDEWITGWFPQPYGELHAVPVTGGPAVRLTHNKWEDGPSDWGRVAIPSGR
jgi:Tol biopolymer transport system component